MDYRPLSTLERQNLIDALRKNAENGFALQMNRKDTTFIGSTEEIPDEEVISCIRSVPCHY
jgi:hypothetical protein